MRRFVVELVSLEQQMFLPEMQTLRFATLRT